MAHALAAVKRSVWLQRSGACLIWTLLIGKVAAVLWLETKVSLWFPWNIIKAFFRPTHWLSTLAMITLQAPVVATQSAVVLAIEKEPLQLPSDIAAVERAVTQLLLRWTPTSLLRSRQGAASSKPNSQGLKILAKIWQSSPIPNCQQAMGRVGSWWQTTKLLLLLLSCTSSAVLTLHLFSYLRTNSTGKIQPCTPNSTLLALHICLLNLYLFLLAIAVQDN